MSINLNHILIIKQNNYQEFVILKQKEYSLGRSYRNDIVIEDKQVSRCHATLLKRKNQRGEECFLIYDGNFKNLKSRNGLIVNQRKCDCHCLQKGDLIQLGDNVQVQYFQFSQQTLELLKMPMIPNFSTKQRVSSSNEIETADLAGTETTIIRKVRKAKKMCSVKE